MTFSWILYSLIHFGLCMLMYRFAIQNHPNLLFRRLFLLSVPVIGFILPLISWSTPLESVSLAEVIIGGEAQQVIHNSTHFLPVSWLSLIYGTGLFLIVLKLLLNYYQAIRLVNSFPILSKSSATLRLASDDIPAFSFWNHICLHKQDLEKSEVLLHEQIHVNQYHSIDKLLFDVLKAIFWFNPFVHSLEKELSQVHELLADEGVLKSTNVNRKTYAELIINSLIGSTLNLPVRTFFKSEGIQNRVLHILNKNPKPNKTIMKYTPLMLIAVLVISLATAACTVEDSSNAEFLINAVVDSPDVQTSFKSTDPNGLSKYLSTAVNYPKDAIANNQTGKVVIEFIVDKTGVIKSPKVIKSSDVASLDAEAIRVISEMPSWNPAEKDGKKVSVKYTIPIAFRL